VANSGPPPREAQEEHSWGVGREELQFFSDFADFANVVNWWLAEEYNSSRWRLQELPKSDLLKLGPHDSPSYGRCYAIFHNQVRVGEMEAQDGWKYSTQNLLK
jgi:hypothetical protein